MALNVELWMPVIQENLYKGVEFIKKVATDDSMYKNGKTIHIPSAGTAPSVTKGNTTYPVTVTERTDQEVTYDLTNYEVGPMRVNGLIDLQQLSYDKAASVVNDMLGVTSDRLAREFMLGYYHYTAGQAVITSGGAVAAHAPSATGNRKLITGADVRNAAKIMDGQLVPSTDRYLILDSEMFYQLQEDFAYGTYRPELSVVDGLTILSKPIYGFTVIMMPVVGYSVVTTNAAKAYGAAGATTDNAFGLAIQKSCASFCMEDISVLTQEKDPTYFADLISAQAYAGAKYRRYDKKGIVPIIQVAA